MNFSAATSLSPTFDVINVGPETTVELPSVYVIGSS